MKCEINLGWHNGTDDMSLSREKEPEEIWGPTPSPRNVIQAIEVLDQTFADMRAAMMALLPKEAQCHVRVVMFVTQEQVRDFMGGEA